MVDSKEKLSKFTEVSWNTFLSSVHQWANFTGQSTEAERAKTFIELYGLQCTQPLNILLEKRRGLYYHQQCYKKLTHKGNLLKRMNKVSREQLEIGKCNELIKIVFFLPLVCWY